MRFIVEGYPAFAYTGGRAFDPQRPVALFVHGAAFDHSVWQWQSRYFAHHGFSVLAVDLPAHGRSPGSARASIGEMARWVASFVESACRDKVHLAGHSMGSLVALETAIRHPDKLASLVLVGTAMPMAVGEPFLAAARDGSEAALDMEAVWGHTRNAQLAASPVPGVTLLGASRRLNARAAAGVLAADLAACSAYRAEVDALRAIAVPTLVLGGKRDQMTPFKAGEAVAREIPGARFVALDAGHSMMGEAPRAVVAALREHWMPIAR
jgi:pimeloyl-ACP methyl ester carboxylesterase